MENELELVSKLAKKIVAVMADVTHVPKAGRNEQFKYDFVMESDALDKIRTACVAHNLVVLPDVLEVLQTPTGATTSGGAPQIRTVVRMQYTLIDAETGYSRSETWAGECIEAQDKGINKAIVAAGKYWMLKTFMVPGGEDPDAISPVGDQKKPAPKPAPKQPNPPAQTSSATSGASTTAVTESTKPPADLVAYGKTICPTAGDWAHAKVRAESHGKTVWDLVREAHANALGAPKDFERWLQATYPPKVQHGAS